MLKHQDALCGRVLSQWWDSTPDAGPQSRPTASFQEQPPTCEVLTHSSADVKKLTSIKSRFYFDDFNTGIFCALTVVILKKRLSHLILIII